MRRACCMHVLVSISKVYVHLLHVRMRAGMNDVCMYACMHVCIYARTVCTYVRAYVGMSVCLYVCMCVRMYVISCHVMSSHVMYVCHVCHVCHVRHACMHVCM